MRERIGPRGMVTVRVLDEKGRVKEFRRSLLRRMLRLPARRMEFRRHNIITRQGDALLADWAAPVPTKTKITGSTGYLQVGTGWSGVGTKENTRCNTPVGAMELMDSTYPKLQAAWGNAGDTTLLYRATFDAGDLNTVGLNEVVLLNGNTTGAFCLAYAQIAPPVTVYSTDTLQVDWAITFNGL